MDFIELVKAKVKSDRHDRFSRSGQLSLGELITQIEVLGETGDVFFDFGYFHPSGIDSWRGSYDELALSYGSSKAPSVETFMKELRGTVGATLTGYKGGDFVMTRNTPVWVAQYGESGHTAVIGVRAYYGGVVIETGYAEF